MMDIMTTLFDQNYITELYGREREDKGRNEERLNSIRNLMQSLSISYEKAMTLLQIPKEEQSIYKEALCKEGNIV